MTFLDVNTWPRAVLHGLTLQITILDCSIVSYSHPGAGYFFISHRMSSILRFMECVICRRFNFGALKIHLRPVGFTIIQWYVQIVHGRKGRTVASAASRDKNIKDTLRCQLSKCCCCQPVFIAVVVFLLYRDLLYRCRILEFTFVFLSLKIIVNSFAV